MSIAVAINEIFSKIGNLPVASILGNMIVDPPDQYFLVAKSLHDIVLLVRLLQKYEFRILLEGELITDVNLGLFEKVL